MEEVLKYILPPLNCNVGEKNKMTLEKNPDEGSGNPNILGDFSNRYEQCKVFVGNINPEIKESELENLASNAGCSVKRIIIPKDRFTGQGRGFAFIELQNEDEVVSMISQSDNKIFQGKKISVNRARKRI